MKIVFEMPKRPYNLDELMLAIEEGKPLNKVINEIKSEIKAYQSDAFYSDDVMMNKKTVLEIIDKYRKEARDESNDG